MPQMGLDDASRAAPDATSYNPGDLKSRAREASWDAYFGHKSRTSVRHPGRVMRWYLIRAALGWRCSEGVWVCRLPSLATHGNGMAATGLRSTTSDPDHEINSRWPMIATVIGWCSSAA